MRILIYNWRDLSHPLAGGAEVYTDRVASALVAQGHQVTLFTSQSLGLPTEEIPEGGYTIIRSGGRHSVYRRARRFWRTHGRGKFDLVIDEINTRPFGCPRFVGDVPVVAVIHQVCADVWSYEAVWPVSWVGRFILEPLWLAQYRTVRCVAVSKSTRDDLLARGFKSVVVIPEGFEGEPRSDLGHGKNSKPTLVFVGRLARNKRPDHAIRVFERLRSEWGDLRLWVIGSGPEEDRLRKAAPSGVEFFGRCSDERKRDLIAMAHVLVATSVREGWGLVVTEAAQLGTVACAYDVPGLRDSVLASGGMLSSEDPIALANVVSAALRRCVAGEMVASAGGVIPWFAVADRILAVATSVAPDRARTGFVGDPGVVGA